MNLRGWTTQSTSVPHELRRLYKVPKSSRKFEPAFDRFRSSAEYEEITDNLSGVELEEFIGFLDEVRSPPRHPSHHSDCNQALEVENLSLGLFQKALHDLWTICGKRGVLPKPYIISEGLSRMGETEFASGGYANVWEGRLVEGDPDPRRVCIKVIKVAVNDGEEGRSDIEKVRKLPSLPPGSFAQFTVTRDFTGR